LIRIAIDVPGGDLPAVERLHGCFLAYREEPALFFHLFGDSALIQSSLNSIPLPSSHYAVTHTTSVMEMGESPSHILKQKKDSSMALAILSVKNGESQAILSAGNTGAQMAGSLYFLGRIASVERPSIAIAFPTLTGFSLLIDGGANADSKPEHLLESARLGVIYAEHILHYSHPKVGLINNGSEEEKGSQLTKSAYVLLKDQLPQFIGFAEGRDLFSGNIQVFITDGFTGNVILKTIEGTSSSLFQLIKQEANLSYSGKIGALFLKKSFRSIKKRMDYRSYGGAPLLGVNGISIICHGSSDAIAIKNAILKAKEMIQMDWLTKISQAN